MSDICLTERDVVLAGHRVTCVAKDLVLEGGPDRRVAEGGDRRALVHDYEDGLTVNWEGDYPGGVTIRGPVRIPERIEGDRLSCAVKDLEVDHPGRRGMGATGRRRALVHDYEDGLTVNWDGDYPGGVKIRGEVEIPDGASLRSLTLRMPLGWGRHTPQDVDVSEALETLRRKIVDLEARVSELESATN